ncbi:hypothetical protein ACFOD4_13990 [Pseudoroseomonas globiformis]|uniref:Uncharacterized protein n=1 Tax=Teichococcus globiformis TaxID=2307229 RepID=A0ABV7G4P7_9PROT
MTAQLLVPRFVAPHFIEIDGSTDLPGPVRRACAFTTAAPGWPRDKNGATHRHECRLSSASGRWQDGGAVHWHTETQDLATGHRSTATGEATALTQAIAAALAAAHAPPGGAEAATDRVLCLAPDFVAMQREPGLPPVWCCAHLTALGTVPLDRPWTHLQTAFIRAWPGGRGQAFRGEMETLPFSALAMAGNSQADRVRDVVYWAADSLPEAVERFRALVFAPRGAMHR